MKTSNNQTNSQSKQAPGKTQRPEVRDNLDSRKNEEFDIKGDDVTHNKKEHKSDHKAAKK